MPKKKKVKPYIKVYKSFKDTSEPYILQSIELIVASAIYNGDNIFFQEILKKRDGIKSEDNLKAIANSFHKHFSKTQLFKKQYQEKNLYNFNELYSLLVKSKNQIEFSSIDKNMLNAVYKLSKFVMSDEKLDETEILKNMRFLNDFITAKSDKIKLDHFQGSTLILFSAFNMDVYLENAQDIDSSILNKLIKTINLTKDEKILEYLIDHMYLVFNRMSFKSLNALDYKRGFEIAKKAINFIEKFAPDKLQNNGEDLPLSLNKIWLIVNSYFDCKEFSNKYEILRDVHGSMYDLFQDDFSDRKQTKKNINSFKKLLNTIDDDLKKIAGKLFVLNKLTLSSHHKLAKILNLSDDIIDDFVSKCQDLILKSNDNSSEKMCGLSFKIKSIVTLLSKDSFKEKTLKIESLLEEIINKGLLKNAENYTTFIVFVDCLNFYINHLEDNPDDLDGKNMVNRVYHKLMDKHPHMKHHKCPVLKSFEVTLIDDFPVEKIKENLIFLKELSSISTLMENTKNLTHKTYLKQLESKGDFEAIKKYLSDAKLNIYNKEQTNSILSMLERLLQGPEIEEESKNEPEESKNEPEESKISILDFTGNIEDIADQLTYKEIHQYFQNLKALNKPKYTLTPSWVIDNTLLQSKDDMIFKVSEDHDIFAKISSKLLRKLDSNLVSEFVSALEKGIIFRNKGQNGIKIINKKLFELKIDGDLRLYTNKIYENSDNEKLIIFDHKGNHNDISKIASSINYELVKVESKYINFSDVSSSSSDEEIIDEVHVMGNFNVDDLG